MLPRRCVPLNIQNLYPQASQFSRHTTTFFFIVYIGSGEFVLEPAQGLDQRPKSADSTNGQEIVSFHRVFAQSLDPCTCWIQGLRVIELETLLHIFLLRITFI